MKNPDFGYRLTFKCGIYLNTSTYRDFGDDIINYLLFRTIVNKGELLNNKPLVIPYLLIINLILSLCYISNCVFPHRFTIYSYSFSPH